MADVRLLISTKMALHFKHRRGPEGFCGNPSVQASTEEARESLHANPKTAKKAGKNMEKVCKAARLSFFWDYVCKLGAYVRKGNQAGFCEHLEKIDLKGSGDGS